MNGFTDKNEDDRKFLVFVNGSIAGEMMSSLKQGQAAYFLNSLRSCEKTLKLTISA